VAIYQHPLIASEYVAALSPFVGDGGERFDRRRAAHLLRRTGFGGNVGEIDQAVRRGLEATVDGLFADDADEEAEYARTFGAVAGKLTSLSSLEGIQAWWVYRMLTTRVPLREKLALFWHGHFASSQLKVENTELMHGQIELFRRSAWGSFGQLVAAIARDPAMLVWLDGQSNTREHPNENFARELMELFTCGISHYTERDVLEAARALTGWTIDGTTGVFNTDEHDAGRKQFLGRSGRFGADDVIDLLLQQPATAEFMARKLLRFFAEPDPPAEIVAEAAQTLVRSQFHVKWLLRDLFMSQYFYSERCLRRRIASPVEYVVGALRMLEMQMPADQLIYFLEQMGQRLLAPPNVKGWDGEAAWIDTGTWAARQQFARMLAAQTDTNPLGPVFDPWRLVPVEMTEPRAVVKRLSDVLMPGELPAEARRGLTSFLVATDDGPQPELFREDESFRGQKIREAVTVVIALPEFHAW
jgi:uncharacterized protein (DUF1800 family)